MRFAGWVAALVLAGGMSATAAPLPAPYPSDSTNLIYNLLFCDQPQLFAQGASGAPPPDVALVLSDTADAAAVRAIADDARKESRIRVLAYNWLRAHGQPVPARQLLGVIVEVPLDGGLDTLAVFADGRIRYINQSGKIVVFEDLPPQLKPKAGALLAAAQAVVDRIGPWDKPRLPPPPKGAVRMTFLASDGLYFGQGAFADLQRDPIGGPVLTNAGALLPLIIDMASKP